MAENKAPALKISNQYRSQTGFMYELERDGTRLTLAIARRQQASDPGEWSVEATSKPDTPPVTAWGATRREALRELGRIWASKASTLGLPAFDWEVVAAVLADVRAV